MKYILSIMQLLLTCFSGIRARHWAGREEKETYDSGDKGWHLLHYWLWGVMPLENIIKAFCEAILHKFRYSWEHILSGKNNGCANTNPDVHLYQSNLTSIILCENIISSHSNCGGAESFLFASSVSESFNAYIKYFIKL